MGLLVSGYMSILKMDTVRPLPEHCPQKHYINDLFKFYIIIKKEHNP